MTSPRTLLGSSGLKAKKQFGQNFLSDPSTSKMIVERAGITDKDTVFEIGPGLGSLTINIAKASKKLTAIEKDTSLLPILNSELEAAGVSNTEVINASILDFVFPEITPDEAETHDPRFILMGNLPYNISSQILAMLVENRKKFKKAVFMLQKELAQRIASPPGSRDYGRISVLVQYCGKIRFLAEIKKHLFFPAPDVDSSVIEITIPEEPEFRPLDEKCFFDTVRSAFGQRRKTLKNALAGGFVNLSSVQADEVLRASGIDPSRRAETLGIEDFVRLADEVYSCWQKSGGGE